MAKDWRFWYPNYWGVVCPFFNIDRDEGLLMEIGDFAANWLDAVGTFRGYGRPGGEFYRSIGRFGWATEMNRAKVRLIDGSSGGES